MIVTFVSVMLAAAVYTFGYLFYFAIADVYAGSPRHISEAELVGLQVFFYAVFVVGLAVAAAPAWILSRRGGVSPVISTTVVMFILGIVAVPLLGFLSFMNLCNLGHSFPFPGASC